MIIIYRYRATCLNCRLSRDIAARSKAAAEAVLRRDAWVIDGGGIERCNKCATTRVEATEETA